MIETLFGKSYEEGLPLLNEKENIKEKNFHRDIYSIRKKGARSYSVTLTSLATATSSCCIYVKLETNSENISKHRGSILDAMKEARNRVTSCF
jgi:hypothetical protein